MQTEDRLFNVANSVAVVPGPVAAICFQTADALQMFGPTSVLESTRGGELKTNLRCKVTLAGKIKQAGVSEASKGLSVDMEMKHERRREKELFISRIPLGCSSSQPLLSARNALYGQLRVWMCCIYVWSPSTACSRPQYGICSPTEAANSIVSFFGTARHSFLTPYFWANTVQARCFGVASHGWSHCSILRWDHFLFLSDLLYCMAHTKEFQRLLRNLLPHWLSSRGLASQFRMDTWHVAFKDERLAQCLNWVATGRNGIKHIAHLKPSNCQLYEC